MTQRKFLLKKLPDGPEITLTADLSVGRSQQSALKLVEGSPSRQHALLSVSGDAVYVEDLGSTNGTFVNDRRIASKVKLKLNSNDRVRFDVEEFLFRVESEPPPDQQGDRTIVRVADAPARASGAPREVSSGPMAAVARERPGAAGAGGERPGAAAAGGEMPGAPVAAVGREVPAAAAARSPGAAARAAEVIPPSEPPKPAAESASSVKVPVGWIDDRSSSGQGTQFMTPEELSAFRQRQSAASDVSSGQVRRPVLIVRGDPEPMSMLLEATAGDKSEWTIGSAGERDICIQRPGVSALHAKIVKQGKRWRVIDQVSANGTFVNGKKCMVSYLSSGDRIAFGSVECTFRLPAAGVAMFDGGGTGSNLKKFLLFAGLSCAAVLLLLVVGWKLGWL